MINRRLAMTFRPQVSAPARRFVSAFGESLEPPKLKKVDATKAMKAPGKPLPEAKAMSVSSTPPPTMVRNHYIHIGGFRIKDRRSLLMFISAVFLGGCAAGFGATVLYQRQSVLGKSTSPLGSVHDPSRDYTLSGAKFYKAMNQIKKILPEDAVGNTDDELASHADTYWNSHHPTADQVAKYIVYPSTTEEVSEVMKICREHKVPVVPMAGASSLEGHFIQTRQGLVIDLSRMDRIIKLNRDDLDVVVQPGVAWEDLKEYLEPFNLMFGPDPGPGAQIGGMVATSCSGTNAFKYGTMKENVLNLTVVMADGTIVKTKQRARKSSAGYNLTGLFIGSEGTLGIITEATLKLHVKPLKQTIAVVPFNSIYDATSAVKEILENGIQLDAMELMDGNMMACVNASGETSTVWTEKPTLFFKIAGASEVIVKELVKNVRDITTKHDSLKFSFAKTEEEKTELWSARKVALWSSINHGRQALKAPDAQLWTTDYAVPISHLPAIISETVKDIEDSGLRCTTVAHAGDANVHHFIVYTPEQKEVALQVVERMVKRAIAVEGTCTGEHGIGYGKREYLLWEVGQTTVDLMRKIKMGLDYYRILNPDKVFQTDPKEPRCEH